MIKVLVVYDSMTGNVQRFVNKLDKFNSIKIRDDLFIDEPFVLITYTTGFGQVPDSVAKFLNQNYTNLKAVAASGNKNWGSYFANSGDVISKTFNVPLILKFEMSGTSEDANKFMQEVKRIDDNLNS